MEKKRKPPKDIYNNLFLPDLKPQLRNGLYFLTNNEWWTTSNAFGKAKGATDCVFCGARVNFYIWSRAGGGKKCDNCGVLVGSWATIADPARFRAPGQFKDLITDEK